MKYNSDEEIFSIVKDFEGRTLAKENWTHETRLTVGLYYTLKHARPIAQKLMRRGICWLNCVHGINNSRTSGYHETLTVFWLDTIAEIVKRNPRKDLAELANTVIETCADERMPLRTYSAQLLFSPVARESYVEPDLYYFQRAA